MFPLSFCTFGNDTGFPVFGLLLRISGIARLGRLFLGWGAATVLVSACSGDLWLGEPNVFPDDILLKKGFEKTWLEAGQFDILAFVKNGPNPGPMVVYIEGDGRAWRSKNRLSSDPTPYNPVGAKLAALDGHVSVVWLARPCQYSKGSPHWRTCRPAYWSLERLSEAVVEDTNRAIDALLRKTRRSGLHLVGFSGGGGLAALIAARRDDVLSLRTVAGTLDTKIFTDHHNVTPLYGSLNPVGVAFRLRALPQTHYVGADDDIVPFSVAQNWRQRARNADCLTVRLMEGVSHGAGWEAVWTQEGKVIPGCPEVGGQGKVAR